EQFSTSAIRGLLNKGLKVPDDVSVIGFSDGELAKRFIPSLTTINQHGAEIGARAARLLIEKLERPVDAEESFQTQIVETSLIGKGVYPAQIKCSGPNLFYIFGLIFIETYIFTPLFKF
ncbi:MAG TPA: LacI family transcriptional regulator, partial [Salinimicrobium catena]|nr:LacI family transcriptional regulator [Salinimicrobium catena]